MRPNLNHGTVVAYLALFVALGGGAWAVTARPSPSGTIRACVNKKTGQLRVISKGSCRRTERALTWNQHGAAGLGGVAGAIGGNGTAGTDGRNGTNGNNGTDGTNGTQGPGAVKGVYDQPDVDNQYRTALNLPAFLIKGKCSRSAGLDTVLDMSVTMPATSGGIVNYTYTEYNTSGGGVVAKQNGFAIGPGQTVPLLSASAPRTNFDFDRSEMQIVFLSGDGEVIGISVHAIANSDNASCQIVAIATPASA